MRAPLSRRLSALRNSYALWTAAAIGVWIAVFALLTLAKYGGDFRGFLHVGSEFRHPAAFSGIPAVGPWGYDGQFYATLATDPCLRSPETASLVDNPRYRAQRIVLPLLAYLVAAGNPLWVTYTYPILCWLFTLSGIGALAVLARDHRVPAWWVFIAGINVGVAASLTRSTPDAPALALLLFAWLAQERNQPVLASLLSLVAVLTRETVLLAVWAVGLASYLRTRRRAALVPALAGTVALLSWTLFLAFRFPQHPGGMGGNLGWPLFGLARKAQTFVHGPGLHLMELSAFLGLLALLVGAARTGRPPFDERNLVLGAFAALALFVTEKVYVEAFAFARVLLPMAWAATLSVGDRGYRRLSLQVGLVLQAAAGLSLVHGEFLAAGGVRHVLGASARALALWFFPR